MHNNMENGLNCTNNRSSVSRRKQSSKKTFAFRPYEINCISEPCPAKSNKIPNARSGHRIVIDNKVNIYSCGGYTADAAVAAATTGDFIRMDNRLIFKELWKFNVASQRWAKLRTSGSMPEELASHATVLLDNQLLVFGGTGVPFGESSSNSLHKCDLKTLTWSKLETTGDHPLQQYGQAVVVHQDKLYVVGGTTGFEYTMHVHCLDLKTKEWSEINTPIQPAPRYRHEVVMENNKLYVFGGGTDLESFPLKEIPVFDIEGKTWELLPTTTSSPDHPPARRHHACVRIDDDVYIVGGLGGRTILSDIWKINLKTLNWEELPCQLMTPVYFHSAAVSQEGQMFIFGGVKNIEENTRTNGLYSVWLKIPSLKEICWQAFLFYRPRIAQLKIQQLLAEGVPLKFLDRVNFKKS